MSTTASNSSQAGSAFGSKAGFSAFSSSPAPSAQQQQSKLLGALNGSPAPQSISGSAMLASLQQAKQQNSNNDNGQAMDPWASSGSTSHLVSSNSLQSSSQPTATVVGMLVRLVTDPALLHSSFVCCLGWHQPHSPRFDQPPLPNLCSLYQSLSRSTTLDFPLE